MEQPPEISKAFELDKVFPQLQLVPSVKPTTSCVSVIGATLDSNNCLVFCYRQNCQITLGGFLVTKSHCLHL